YRFLRPLIIQIGPLSRLLSNVLLLVAAGKEGYVFECGAYRLVSGKQGSRYLEGLNVVIKISNGGEFASLPALDPENMLDVATSPAKGRIRQAISDKGGMVINLGDAILDEMPGQPMIKLHRRYLRTIDLIVAAAAALRESGRTAVPECPPNSEDTILWTFESQQFAPQRRLRVRVGASGYVHAGVAREGGTWEP